LPPVKFIGEHLLPGQLGHLLAVLSFVAALFSAFAYWRAARAETRDAAATAGWMRLGRGAFWVHSLAVVGIFVALYYIISRHLFEYHYAWEHSNRSLPMKYLLSCFWEGQQGSFLLWTFWQAVLGLVVMRTARSLESRAMTVISLVQAGLGTMLLGLYLGPDIKVGGTPFALLRDVIAAPIFSQPAYLSLVTDGNGLNPLLQNYWMVIHPPVLFLGFAATLIPFAYALAALWKGDYKAWVRPALRWSLFGGGVLGLGIMMGGAWAYESLNFGGYWAWDPVENASLVPWLTLVAGAHTLLVFRHTGRALSTTLIFFGLTYALIWYSTFLTRTGVLGDTSVHAFTGEGKSLTWHLLVVIGGILAGWLGLLIARWRGLPKVQTEEAATSREFWMTIGSFVLLLSAVQIIITTSIPVWSPLAKAISGKDVAPPVDPVKHYNSVQIWVGILIAFGAGFALFLKYKTASASKAARRLGIAAAAGLAITLGLALAQGLPLKGTTWPYWLLLYTASFGAAASILYAAAVQKRLRSMGGAVAHLGFAVLLIGILFSSWGKEVISFNTLGIDLGFDKKDPKQARENHENVVLYRNVPVALGDYFAIYRGDSLDEEYTKDKRAYYAVEFQRRDSTTGRIREKFTLLPDAFINPRGQEGLSPNPDAKWYWNRDIFTYVSSVAAPERRTQGATWKDFTMRLNDTVAMPNALVVFEGFDPKASLPAYQAIAQPGDIAVAAQLRVLEADGPARSLSPVYYIRGRGEQGVDDSIQTLGLHARLTGVIPDSGAARISLRSTNPAEDYVVLKAIVFPLINLVWLGTILMVAGFGLSWWNRRARKTDVA